MVTVTQVLRKKRINKRKLKESSAKGKGLQGCCQKKGIVVRLFTMSPRKPNSAVRKVAKVLLRGNRTITAYIPGQGHVLQRYSTVIVEGGRAQDTPGVPYTLVRGLLDFRPVESFVRVRKRSKYGIALIRFFKKKRQVRNARGGFKR